MNRFKTVLLILVFVISASLLVACHGGTSIDIDNFSRIENSKAESYDTSSVVENSTPEGYTESPDVTDVVNITASRVAIGGTCEDGAVVTINGAKEVVEVNSVGGFFIAEVELRMAGENRLEVTAKVDGKDESLESIVNASYKATIAERVDGWNVLIGKNSQLFLKDKTMADYLGENLLSTSELKAFKAAINANYELVQSKNYSDLREKVYNEVYIEEVVDKGIIPGNLEPDEMEALYQKIDDITDSRLEGQVEEIPLLYVLVPNPISIYSELSPIETTTNTTRYQQIVKALGETKATVIDMTEILMAHKDDEYPIFSRTNSTWTEYGAYFAYEAIFNEIAKLYPDAAPRALSDFNINVRDIMGGDMAGYLNFDRNTVRDIYAFLEPKNFTINFNTYDIYTSEEDITPITKASAELIYPYSSRRVLKTSRENLPNVVFHRDELSAQLYNIFAERCSQTVFTEMNPANANPFTPRRTDVGLENRAEYYVFLCSEMNLDKLISSGAES